MYELGTSHYLRAAAASVGLGVPMGVVGWMFLPPGSGIGFFSIFIGFFLGSGIGALFVRAITRATGGKRGFAMQAIAIQGIVLILVTRFALAGLPFDQLRYDLIGPVAAFIAASVAWQQLR
ncbi:MAG: hypothetical protein DWG75_02165 [Chloroflexi bacterium]|nr:hypothetical protein [Chloroflexota bacterium]